MPPNSIARQMRKYYVGLAILSAVLVGVVIAVISADAPKRNDRVVSDQLSRFSNTMNSYVSANKRLPADMAELYTKNAPPALEYQRLADSVYMVCATFKLKATGYDTAYAEKTSSSLDFYIQQQQQNNPTVAYKAVDMYGGTVSAGHEKGKNCYLVQDDTLTSDKGANIFQQPVDELKVD